MIGIGSLATAILFYYNIWRPPDVTSHTMMAWLSIVSFLLFIFPIHSDVLLHAYSSTGISSTKLFFFQLSSAENVPVFCHAVNINATTRTCNFQFYLERMRFLILQTSLFKDQWKSLIFSWTLTVTKDLQVIIR